MVALHAGVVLQLTDAEHLSLHRAEIENSESSQEKLNHGMRASGVAKRCRQDPHAQTDMGFPSCMKQQDHWTGWLRMISILFSGAETREASISRTTTVRK